MRAAATTGLVICMAWASAPAWADDASSLIDQATARTAALEARARRAQDDRALDLLERARNLLRKAERREGDDRSSTARNLVLKAERVLHRAEDSLAARGRRNPGRARDKARSVLADVDGWISAATQAVSLSGDPAAKRQLRAAKANRRRAAQALARGDTGEARRLAKAAKRAALQSQERAARGERKRSRKKKRRRRLRRR